MIVTLINEIDVYVKAFSLTQKRYMKTNLISVIIIEEDLSYSLELKSLLEEINCKVITSFNNLEIAIKSLPKLSVLPDLIIADIVLKNKLTGIDVAKAIKYFDIPFIFFSSYANEQSYQEALSQNMLAYIKKPIDKFTLKSIIDQNLNRFTNTIPSKEGLKTFIMVKVNKNYQRISIDEIRYIEASGNYCYLYTQSNKYLVKSYLSNLVSKFNPSTFLRIHRSYAINITFLKIINIEENTVQLNQEEILPISLTGKKMLLSLTTFL